MPTPSTTRLPPARGRTPPDLKWLLAERAALLGRLGKQHVHTLALQADVAQAELAAEAARELLRQHLDRQRESERLVEALARTVALAHPLVDASELGPVNAWTGQFGQRGALIRFLRQAIEAAGPAGCTTSQLLKEVQDAFGLCIGNLDEWQALRGTVRGRLRELRDQHRAITSTRAGPGLTAPAVWRSSQGTSMDALRALAAAAEACDDHPPDPNAF